MDRADLLQAQHGVDLEGLELDSAVATSLRVELLQDYTLIIALNSELYFAALSPSRPSSFVSPGKLVCRGRHHYFSNRDDRIEGDAMTSEPETQRAPLSNDPMRQQQQAAMQQQQRQLEQQRKPQADDVVATALPGALIYTVQKGANTVPDFSTLSAALTTLFGRFAPKNARLRNKITQALKNHPELEAVVYDVVLKQPSHPTPEQVHANLQARAQAIIARHPELEADLKD